MSRGSDRRQRGFTLFEVVVAILVAAVVMLLALRVTASSSELSEVRHIRLRASALHRRGHEAIDNVLRAVDPTSLQGFDAQGVATAPAFARVTGHDGSALTRTGPETLQWQPVGPVDGVTDPGAVYYTDESGNVHRVAQNVPRNGFSVRREGRNLVVHLATYYGPDAASLVQLEGETVVSVRN